jgi:hypothetical protein
MWQKSMLQFIILSEFEGLSTTDFVLVVDDIETGVMF